MFVCVHVYMCVCVYVRVCSCVCITKIFANYKVSVTDKPINDFYELLLICYVINRSHIIVVIEY